MTRIADLQDRLLRLARRREDEGIYTDANLVEAASARIAELEAENERLENELALVGFCMNENAERAMGIAVRVEAAEARVKALEWGETRHTDDYSFAQDAVTSIGTYIATDNGWFLHGQSGWNGEASIEEAKAAAQADFEHRILSALEATRPSEQAVTEADKSDDAVAELFVAAWAEADKAMRKFPQPNYVISKVAEEAGEVVKAAIHCAEGRETPANVIAEIRQTMAMLLRLYVEGDQVHGLPPLKAAMEAGR